MMRKNRKTLAWIGAAFLLLCAVSVYRQLSMGFLPGDPVRPVLVYFVYLLLLAGWWNAICARVTQRNMRIFLLAEHALMVFGVTIRFVQDALLCYDIFLMRVSGYWVVLPIVLFPLFGFYASLGLGRAEEYHMSRRWYFLLVPGGMLIFLILTNESHHLVFRLMEGETQANLYFHPNVGVFVIIIWALALEMVRIFLIFCRSRELEDHHHLRIVPFLIAVFMLLFNIPYLSGSFVVRYELIEYAALLFFLEVMVWESCILVGMVPVNTRYGEVFDRSTVAMRIVDEKGQLYLKSARAPELSPLLFPLLKQQRIVRTAQGQELHLHQIHGGYAIWQKDISTTLAVIDELTKSTEKLEYEGELLRQELRFQSDETAIREQNRIYNQLTYEVGGQLSLLRGLLEELEEAEDKAELFRKICLMGTYVKRRCNLRLIEQSDGVISNEDLELCFYELVGCLRQMGVEADVLWHDANKIPASEFAIFTLDMFEYLLEYEHFTPGSISAVFERDAVFRVRVNSCGAGLEQAPLEELMRLGKGNFYIKCEIDARKYEVSVSVGG